MPEHSPDELIARIAEAFREACRDGPTQIVRAELLCELLPGDRENRIGETSPEILRHDVIGRGKGSSVSAPHWRTESADCWRSSGCSSAHGRTRPELAVRVRKSLRRHSCTARRTSARYAPRSLLAVTPTQSGAVVQRQEGCEASSASNSRIIVNKTSAVIGLLATRRLGSRGSSLIAADVSPVMSMAFRGLESASRSAVMT